jgi:glutamate-5-semialdehyde dehydrogenase
VPVFAHLEGICHVYVDKSADLDMAVNRRQRQDAPHRHLRRGRDAAGRRAAPTHLAPLVDALLDAGCEVRGDDEVRALFPRVKPATRRTGRPNISTRSSR